MAASGHGGLVQFIIGAVVVISIIDELQLDPARGDVPLGERRMGHVARRLARRDMDVVLLAQVLEQILVPVLEMGPQIGGVAMIGQHLVALDADHVLLGDHLVVVVRGESKVAPIDALHLGRVQFGEVQLRHILILELANGHRRRGYLFTHLRYVSFLSGIGNGDPGCLF